MNKTSPTASQVALKVRYSVCAVAYLTMSLEEYAKNPSLAPLDVIGTGFLVGPRRVMTCSHVIDSLRSHLKKRHLPWDRALAEFVYPAPRRDDGAWRVIGRPFQVNATDAKGDIAMLDIIGPWPVESPPAVTVVEKAYAIAVGEEVSVCGYAHGSTILRRGKKIGRFGPVLQRGIVAALSPYENRPDVALLDIVTGPAASGSPVFNSKGEVLAILQEGQAGKTAAFAVARLIFRSPGLIFARMANTEPMSVRLNKPEGAE